MANICQPGMSGQDPVGIGFGVSAALDNRWYRFPDFQEERMPARRLSMRKIREVLRLKLDLGLKDREIARSCSIPHSTVANYLDRAKDAGLGWPLLPEFDDK